MSQDSETVEEVLRTIRQIVRRISEHSRHLSREVGLTVPQLVCLKAIGKLENVARGLTVRTVAAEVQLSPSTVSRIIDRLARAGLVTRDRDAKDRRRVCLLLTPAGIERVQTLPVPLQERFVEGLLAVPAEERKTLLQSLRQIAQLMEAQDLDAAPLLTPGETTEPLE